MSCMKVSEFENMECVKSYINLIHLKITTDISLMLLMMLD